MGLDYRYSPQHGRVAYLISSLRFSTIHICGLQQNKPRYGHRFDNIVLAALAYREAGVQDQDVDDSVWKSTFYYGNALPENCPKTRALVDGSLDEWVKVHDWTVFPCAW